MEESYQEKLAEHERQDQKLFTKIQTINDSLNHLKQDVTFIKDEVEEMRVTELLEKINLVVNKTDDNLTRVKNQIDTQKEELLQSKEHKKPTPRTSEYRRLQNMLQSFNNANRVSNQLNNSMTTNKTFRQSPSKSQKAFRKSPLGDSQNTVSMSDETKAFRGFPSKFNKNIITRTSTSKNTKKINVDTYEEESPSLIKNEDIPPSDHTIEEKSENHTETENQQELNLESFGEQKAKVDYPREEEVTHLSADSNTLESENEKTDEEMGAIDNNEMLEADRRLNKSNKKSGSFFSFFRKS